MRASVLGSGSRLHILWLCAAMLLAAAAACGEAEPQGSAPGKGVYIGEKWSTARRVTGHEAHVVGEKIACNKCHELTADAIGAVTPERCAECHEKESRIEHAAAQARERFGPGATADCTTCHAFTREGSGHPELDAGVHGAGDCKHCHLERQGDTPAVVVHKKSECLSCHRPHDDKQPQPGECAECHEDITPTHATAGKTPIEVCTTCHQNQHAPASDARPTCAECHAKEKPVVAKTALFADGHTECVGCHRPHEFKQESAVACRSCHEDVITLGATRVKQHAQCNSCHAAHDVRGSPDKACASCHKDKQPDHPKHGVAGTCVGCHDPHPSRAHAQSRVRNCSSCHQAAAADTSFHGGTECTKCHGPHDFVRPASDRSACAGCHGTELGRVAGVKGHQSCEGCHGGLPHRPATLTAGCESCHASVHKSAVSGHRECTSCHEPHGGSLEKECRSCHQEEHRTAPAGHQDCKSCHQPHTGSTAKVSCRSCHAAEHKTPHATVKGGCNSCHRAHGPTGPATPPACASCHTPSKLPGLHSEPKHQACARCHTGHGEPALRAARAECLSCHTAQANHFPDAPRCSSCHLFTKTR